MDQYIKQRNIKLFDFSHQRRLVISRHEADLVRGGDGGAGGARGPG